MVRCWHPDIEQREKRDLQTGYLGNPGTIRLLVRRGICEFRRIRGGNRSINQDIGIVCLCTKRWGVRNQNSLQRRHPW